MTDKEQIIIDGVDVSECAYFDYENEGTTECDAYGNECEANNCYFKQLARKTQECEKRGEIISDLIGCVSLWEEFTEEESKLAKDSSIADLIMLLRKKTQEYDELKRQYESRKGLLNSVGKDNYRLMRKCEELEEELELNTQNAVVIDMSKRLYGYRKALEEIEEYCDKQIAVTGDLPFKTTESDILDIINKAKGEENVTF